MKSVFLSSVSQGFKRYRDAAHDAINKMDGYHCRRMEQFGPRDCDPAEFCKKEVAKCDLFVGLVGLRYGSCPPGSDKSFSQLEYDAAIALNKPTLMIGMSDEFPVPGNLIESDTQREKQRRFRSQVLGDSIVALASNSGDVREAVVVGIHNLSRSDDDKLRATILDAMQEQIRTLPLNKIPPDDCTKLLFPFITNWSGFDTGISITNTTRDPFGTEPLSGSCTLYYYGRYSDGIDECLEQTSAAIGPGEQLIFTLSAGSSSVKAVPGFQGYLIVDCRFPRARGFATIGHVLGVSLDMSSGYLAEVISDQ